MNALDGGRRTRLDGTAHLHTVFTRSPLRLHMPEISCSHAAITDLTQRELNRERPLDTHHTWLAHDSGRVKVSLAAAVGGP